MNFKVMTFNLRIKAESDGINIFDNRTANIINAIRTESPHLIGFQEVTDDAREMLRRELSPQYTLLGCGRKENMRGEGVCIAYRNESFELVSYHTFWLSDTPTVAGSRYEDIDQSTCARVTVRASLSPTGSSEVIHFFNTHLDHKGRQARVKGMSQIKTEIEKYGGSFILTGDMNDRPDSECIGVALSIDGATDTTADIKTTFHNFGRLTEDCKIDYIITNMSASGAYCVADEHRDGIYISDHYPVCTTVSIEK